MPLFQQSVLKKYLKELDEMQLDIAWKKFQNHFHNPVIQQNILHAKEEEYQEGFVRDLFVNVLGYTLKPQPDFNLVLEQKSTTDATKSDGAVLSTERNVIAVIELKDTATADLGKVEKQAFGYKHQHKDCRYIIISNFQQLRFYINDAIDYEAFDLFRLDKNSFALLYCCLQQKALQTDVPLRMKQQSVAAEENVTKKLYDDYSRFKKQLFENITKLNQQYDQLVLFKKTQKLLDRFLFILFAEDRGLLPPNSVREILRQWEQLKELDNYVPLYERFKKYFGYLDTGYAGKQYEIFAYNGGLFAPDEVLDTINIDDSLLFESCTGLSNYDFESEIDVNILGHIFEHSLNEIEEIEQQLTSPRPYSRPLSGGERRSQGVRKKDGVFYTPRYITKYIVENTVGALCTQKRKELNIADEDYAPQKRKANTQQLLQKLETYRDWLLQLTICDPACGSGAFLNQALEFLIAEHHRIDDLKAKLFGDTIVFTDVENSILENNLFGVDINEEATDIAKLSLWLRTARKGRKLNKLSGNIKRGNSLIDDTAIAGDKAFNWHKEFPKVFEKGGFDVVIGNPPYVPAEMIKEKEKRYYEAKYHSAVGRLNLYPLFYELAIKIGYEKSKVGIISPYTLLKNQYYSHSRKFILSKSFIEKIIDFKGAPVFADAAVDSIIIILTVDSKSNHSIEIVDSIKDFPTNDFAVRQIDQNTFENREDFSFEIANQRIDLDKLKTTCTQIKNVVDFNQGVITGDNKKYLTTQKNNQTKKVITGRDFNRYSINWNGEYLIYDETKLHRPRKKTLFESSEKILIRQTASFPICAYDDSMFYTLDTVHNGVIINSAFDLKFIMTLLNSRLFKYLYETSINEEGKVFAQVKIIYINPLPIKIVSPDQQLPFIAKADIMLSKNKELQSVKQHLLQFLIFKFEDKGCQPSEGWQPSKKLQDWPNLTFSQFLKELEKQKIKLTLPEQSEWMQYFETEKSKANAIQLLIDKTDSEIDAMVYELYGLTEEEIKVVTNL